MSCGFNNYYCHPEVKPCGCGCAQPRHSCEKPVNYCDCSQCHKDYTVCCNSQCVCSLAEDLCQYVNQKVLITIGGCKIPVIICEVTECIVKAIGYTSCGKVYYFNLNRIDSVEAILPRY